MTLSDSDDVEDQAKAPAQLASKLVDYVITHRQTADGPTFVAIDGRSGAGKSTIADAFKEMLLERHGLVASVIEGDQFYAGGTGDDWDLRSAEEKADRVIDWRRQFDVLQQLRTDGRAEWFPFDWSSPDWSTDPPPLETTPMSCDLTDVVVLEGAYSTRPELHELLDLRVLLDTPAEQRREQLLQREGDAYRSEWEGRWSAAEDHYFGSVMTADRFDIVL